MQSKKVASQKEVRLATTEKANMVETGGVGADRSSTSGILLRALSCPSITWRKRWPGTTTSSNPHFPVDSLHHKNVLRHICELHSATHKVLKAMLAAITSRTLPSLSILIDIWEDKFCSNKLLGFRIR